MSQPPKTPTRTPPATPGSSQREKRTRSPSPIWRSMEDRTPNSPSPSPSPLKRRTSDESEEGPASMPGPLRNLFGDEDGDEDGEVDVSMDMSQLLPAPAVAAEPVFLIGRQTPPKRIPTPPAAETAAGTINQLLALIVLAHVRSIIGGVAPPFGIHFGLKCINFLEGVSYPSLDKLFGDHITTMIRSMRYLPDDKMELKRALRALVYQMVRPLATKVYYSVMSELLKEQLPNVQNEFLSTRAYTHREVQSQVSRYYTLGDLMATRDTYIERIYAGDIKVTDLVDKATDLLQKCEALLTLLEMTAQEQEALVKKHRELTAAIEASNTEIARLEGDLAAIRDTIQHLTEVTGQLRDAADLATTDEEREARTSAYLKSRGERNALTLRKITMDRDLLQEKMILASYKTQLSRCGDRIIEIAEWTEALERTENEMLQRNRELFEAIHQKREAISDYQSSLRNISEDVTRIADLNRQTIAGSPVLRFQHSQPEIDVARAILFVEEERAKSHIQLLRLSVDANYARTIEVERFIINRKDERKYFQMIPISGENNASQEAINAVFAELVELGSA